MEPKRSADAHLKALEHDMTAAFAPFAEMMNQSRAYMERSLTAMRDETVDLLNKLHGHNGDALAECTGSRDLASLAAAQERWLIGFGRDLYESNVRIGEATRGFLADSLECVGHVMRNGNGRSETAETLADDAEDAGDTAVRGAAAFDRAAEA